MNTNLALPTIYASLRQYLHELAESGVEGLPLANNTTADNKSIQPFPLQIPATEQQETVALPLGKLSTLEEIRSFMGNCQRCNLAASRKNLVFGCGNPKAKLVFVGEAPGADEDRQGEPFVGEAGHILARIINAMGFERSDVYICNVLKCRPPGNRNPDKNEITTCSQFMLAQLQVIKPEAVVALGTFAAQTLLETKEAISKLRGKFHQYQGIPLMPTFHPAFLLRNRANKQLYWDVWEDMVMVLKLLGLPVPDKQRK